MTESPPLLTLVIYIGSDKPGSSDHLGTCLLVHPWGWLRCVHQRGALLGGNTVTGLVLSCAQMCKRFLKWWHNSTLPPGGARELSSRSLITGLDTQFNSAL